MDNVIINGKKTSLIGKSDIILLLTDLQKQGIDIGDKIQVVIKSQGIDMDVIKFINDNRQLDLIAFYEKIRKSYNQHHSTLYKNIMESTTDVDEVLTTLAAMQTQILLFSKNIEDKKMFFKFSRVEEINFVLTYYYDNFDLQPAMKLIKLIKADILALETIYRTNKYGNKFN